MFKILSFGIVAALLFFIFSASNNSEIKTNNINQAEAFKKLREENDKRYDLKEAQRKRWKDEFNTFGTLNSDVTLMSGCAKEMKIALDKINFSVVEFAFLGVEVSPNKAKTEFEEYFVSCDSDNKKMNFEALWNAKNPSNSYFQNIAELWQMVDKRQASDIIKRVSACFSKASKTKDGYVLEKIIIGNAALTCKNLGDSFSISVWQPKITRKM